MLVIEDTPYPKRRTTGSKYDADFDRLQVDQCVRCDPKEVATTSNALRKYLERKGREGLMVRQVAKCDDGYARIWLLKRPVTMASVKGRKIVNLAV